MERGRGRMSEDFPEPSQSPEIRREDSRGLSVIRTRTQKLRSVSTPAAYTNSDTQTLRILRVGKYPGKVLNCNPGHI